MQNDLILLHGWGMNKSVWQLCEKELSNEYNGAIYSLNLPGFGGAAVPDKEYSLASAVQQLAKQINDNSTIVAWSLGGLFALYLAKYYPKKVSKVVLVSSSPCFVEQDEWEGVSGQVLDKFKDQLVQDSNKTIDRFLAIQAMGSEHAKEDIKALRALLKLQPVASKQALSVGLELLQKQDLRTLFSRLSIPMYGVFGCLDTLVPKRVCARMSELNPDFSYKMIEKASHAPFISHRDEFISYLKSIL
ncbi:Pimeloyl-[acyl-carrier protein] methyl ester esterase [Pseudoalteromonas holothuriae]|uniref:Pimeloyl-[acyl-carrier protein] methyl ester esterase n=1 Tax=Pseudoalteromonas holothuriae TaxID=2963714 RepID=A0A9W4QUE8_9GAMM|nr:MULTISPECIES: pimeloyl-ACP methyl ester esterase BioH [unclassified Pseudoalteromonas]CAH9054072.1 Pimeloyl-[acyl-carrier protein] methyl ester esterase [Pseudoalteromonas sp. CIP111854]CAH9058622.1 Pimeloyl-[acyl-carrier protein] methyl ester esterase [Pseudoalteromonas sp. CIP111951]